MRIDDHFKRINIHKKEKKTKVWDLELQLREWGEEEELAKETEMKWSFR